MIRPDCRSCGGGGGTVLFLFSSFLQEEIMIRTEGRSCRGLVIVISLSVGLDFNLFSSFLQVNQ